MPFGSHLSCWCDMRVGRLPMSSNMSTSRCHSPSRWFSAWRDMMELKSKIHGVLWLTSLNSTWDSGSSFQLSTLVFGPDFFLGLEFLPGWVVVLARLWWCRNTRGGFDYIGLGSNLDRNGSLHVLSYLQWRDLLLLLAVHFYSSHSHYVPKCLNSYRFLRLRSVAWILVTLLRDVTSCQRACPILCLVLLPHVLLVFSFPLVSFPTIISSIYERASTYWSSDRYFLSSTFVHTIYKQASSLLCFSFLSLVHSSFLLHSPSAFHSSPPQLFLVPFIARYAFSFCFCLLCFVRNLFFIV